MEGLVKQLFSSLHLPLAGRVLWKAFSGSFVTFPPMTPTHPKLKVREIEELLILEQRILEESRHRQIHEIAK